MKAAVPSPMSRIMFIFEYIPGPVCVAGVIPENPVTVDHVAPVYVPPLTVGVSFNSPCPLLHVRKALDGACQ